MPSSTERLYAVCIGVNQCPRSARLQTKSLNFAEKDAEDLYNLLLKMGFEKDKGCLLTGKDATLDAINNALREWVINVPRRNDLVLVYFAGHGIPLLLSDSDGEEEDQQSEVFLAPYDFDENRIKEDRGYRLDEALSMERLRNDFFIRTLSNKVLFIFDSCYSGDFFGPNYRSEVLDPVQSYIKHMFAQTSAGMRVALSSCLPIQFARESKQFGHGLFTHHLLEALNGNVKEALRPNGCITVGSLFDYLCEKLPENQRPVKSGVEHDAFKLICYPDKVESIRTDISIATEHKNKRYNSIFLLKTMFADHDSFLHNRLESFVGRQRELDEIQQRIKEKVLTGGYIAITGQAGQGKSSVIAKLVQECGSPNASFHFIPFNPGPDHQVGLLRNLMARLILKYDLSDLYIASESRAALRDYFPKVLADLTGKGGQEVIFIDGLDQLEEEFDGSRDLSFLPTNPPPGIVFVLGTRPNDTLQPLELLKPYDEYKLPNLSRYDFDLILRHRKVILEKDLADLFYKTMQENALYLDLVARELLMRGDILPTEIIKQVADDPDNLFTFAVTRLKRKSADWRGVIKPLLGVLLVAREPLAKRYIRQIIQVDEDQINDALKRLGGLVNEDGHQGYYLFHSKLREFLQQRENVPGKKYIFANDEEEAWHGKLAKWCEQDNFMLIWQDVTHSVWEQGRLEYARKHYIAHLYYAREWQQLFSVLDNDEYGRSKLQHDSSTRSYVQDLDFGRQAASWEGWTVQEAIMQLPHLCRYTLLRCSLISRADSYSIERFEALVMQGRKKEAIEIAELLTDLPYKVTVLLRIALQLNKQIDTGSELLYVLIRAHEVAKTIKNIYERANLCCEIGKVFSYVGQLKEAEAVWEDSEALADIMEEKRPKLEILRKIIEMLLEVKNFDRTIAVIQALQGSEERAVALLKLGQALENAQKHEEAGAIWHQAEAAIYNLKRDHTRTDLLSQLSFALIHARQWERAETVIRTIQENRTMAINLMKLGQTLVEAEQRERAEIIWSQAEAVTQNIEDEELRMAAFQDLGKTLVKAQQNERAAVVWMKVELQAFAIPDKRKSITALVKLSEALMDVQQWERATDVLDKVRIMARSCDEGWEKVDILHKLGLALTKNRQWEQADAIWIEAEMMATLFEENLDVRIWGLGELMRALNEIQQENRGEQLIEERGHLTNGTQQTFQSGSVEKEVKALSEDLKKHKEKRIQTIHTRIHLLVQAHQWTRAESVIQAIKENEEKATGLRELGQGLAEVQQWEYADVIWTQAEIVTQAIETKEERTKALYRLSQILMQAQQWERAEDIIYQIDDISQRAITLGELGLALAKSHIWDRAEMVWEQAQATAYALQEDSEKATTLTKLIRFLIEGGQWRRASVVIDALDDFWKIRLENEADDFLEIGEREVRSLVEVEDELWENRQGEQAEGMRTMEEIIDSGLEERRESRKNLYKYMRVNYLRRHHLQTDGGNWREEENRRNVSILRELGSALAKAQQWKGAESVWAKVESLILVRRESLERITVLRELGKAFMRSGQRERAISVWTEAKKLTDSIEDKRIRYIALQELYETFIQEQLWEEAEDLRPIFKGVGAQLAASQTLSRALIQARQWNRAEAVIKTIELNNAKAIALSELGKALLNTQREEYAQAVFQMAQNIVFTIPNNEGKLDALYSLCELSIQAQLIEETWKIWAEAMNIAHKLEKQEERKAALHGFWKLLIQSKQWIRIRANIYKVKDKLEKVMALEELALVLHQANQQKQVEVLLMECETILRTIMLSLHKAEALYDLSKILIQIGLSERAEAVARIIEEKETQAKALLDLSTFLVQKGHLEQAIAVAQTIERDWAGAEAFRRLSLAFAEAEQWAEAEWFARAIENTEEKAKTSYELCRKLMEAHQWERAKLVADAIDITQKKIASLGELSCSLAKDQQKEQAEELWMEAEAIIHTVRVKDERVSALIELGLSLADAGHLKRADKIWTEATDEAYAIRDDEKRIEATRKLCEALVQTQCWGRLAHLARSLEEKEERDFVLSNLSRGLAGVYRWDRAEAIGRAIKDREKRIETLLDLNSTLIQLRQWKRAKKLAESVEVEEKRTVALYDLSNALREAQLWEEAVEVAWSIVKSEERKKILRSIISSLETAKDYKLLVRLMHMSFLRSLSRSDVLTTFSFANGIISLKPEIGTSFHEALAWTEKFLAD